MKHYFLCGQLALCLGGVELHFILLVTISYSVLHFTRSKEKVSQFVAMVLFCNCHNYIQHNFKYPDVLGHAVE